MLFAGSRLKTEPSLSVPSRPGAAPAAALTMAASETQDQPGPLELKELFFSSNVGHKMCSWGKIRVSIGTGGGQVLGKDPKNGPV